MAGRSERKLWKLMAALLLAGLAAACGGNSTAVGVIVTAPGVTTGSTATVLANGTLQFAATVTGASATTVYWRICKPAATATTQPTNCTAIPGVTPTGTTSLTGYGTITQTGLYTAPPTAPDPNTFVVLAISSISSHINDTTGTVNTEFGIVNMQIDTGVRVQVFPTSATIGASQTIGFTATVTGTANSSVNWSVNGVAGGNAQSGFISSSGVYTAPASGASSATITATAAADTNKSATASVTVSTTADATVTKLDPNITNQGSAQQDVYVSGSNFFSNDTVYVAAPGQAAAAVTTTFINTGLLRATIPANLMSNAGNDQLTVIRQNGSPNIPGPFALTVSPIRPSIVASSPDSFSQNPSASTTLTLTGGFFSPATTASFNGSSAGITTSFSTGATSSRQLSVAIPAGNLSTPGLYPVVVQNSGIASPAPSISAVNVAVTPSAANIPTGPVASLALSAGASPSAVAVDYATGIAVVANTGSNTVSFINLNTKAVLGSTPVGRGPTGVAIDDMLPTHIAVVVNSTDQTVTTINLTTFTSIGAYSVAIGPTGGSPAGSAPVPYSVGINPLTHRAIVAYQSFNEATIIDIPATGVLVPQSFSQIGGDLTAPIGTGTTPNIAVDERLNWAVVTPGGGGAQSTSIVDLGHLAMNGDVARTAQVVASLGLATTGVGINGETHQVLFTTPSIGTLTSFSLLDNTVNSITFTNGGLAVDQLGYASAATNPLENIGIAVNSQSATASIVDLENGNVLQNNVSLPGSGLPLAVAVDPITNLAAIVNQGSNSVSLVSLGSTLNALQIVQSNPAVTFTSATPLTLTITGGTFTNTSVVRVDQIPLATTFVSSRELTATVPVNLLGSARNFAVDVLSAGAVSNVAPLTVVQSIVVGDSPVGVAVDQERDLAVVTNSGSGSVSLVALSATTPVGVTQTAAGAVGTIGSPLTVGTNPLGVAVIPRLGLAIVANNTSNNASLIDETQASVPQTVLPCGSTSGQCTGPTAAAINQDTAQAVITNAGILNDTAAPSSISFGTLTQSSGTAPPTLGSTGTDGNIDQNPVSAAIDPAPVPQNPGVSYVAVGTASQTSSVEIINQATLLPQRISGFENPTGLIFDSLNQMFIAANSLNNSLVIIDPNTLVQTPVRVGINPTALDYDIQTSTLVTSNLASHTLSVLDYVCPPSTGNPGCMSPRVRAVIGLGGSQQFSVSIDPKLNIAVVADQANGRVLLVPLPH